MMGGIDGMGDMVTGSLVAGAVEPAHGRIGRDGHTEESVCLNCGTPLVGAYCHACGQHAHVHRTLTAFAEDFLSGVLNFEGKILRTVPLLAWKPGEMTRRYIEGQRARFVSPLALFLFAVFFFFAVIQSVGDFGNIGKLTDGEQAYHSTDEAIAGARREVAELEKARAAAEPKGQQKIDEQIAAKKTELATLQKIKDQGIGNAVLSEATSDGDVQSDIPWVNKVIADVKANPQLALYKLQDATSKYAWALIPISVPFVWLLFPFNRRYRLYDHTVFVTYSLSFMLLLFALISLWGATGLGGAAAAVLIIPPLHMFRQLQGAYGLSRRSAIVRTVLLLFFSLIAFGLFAALIAVLGVAG